MAKKIDDLPEVAIDPAYSSGRMQTRPDPVPFVHTPLPNPSPTEAQQKWLQDHPAHIRISHAAAGRFVLRGTLRPDGTFTPDTVAPIIDGAGCFGVGVPSSR